jgi:hypothetical protein
MRQGAEQMLSLRSRRKRKAWGVSPRHSQIMIQPVITGESEVCKVLPPAIAGFTSIPTAPWGSRPRLYAYACLAG